MNKELFERYIDLHEEKKNNKLAASAINEELAQLEPQLIEQMIDLGLDKLTMKNMTLYLKERVFVKYKLDDFTGQPIDRGRVMAALKEANLSDLCPETIQAQRLNAYLQEIYDNGEELPEPLKDLIEPNPVPQLGRRKAA